MLNIDKYLDKIKGFYHIESLIKIIHSEKSNDRYLILNQIKNKLIDSGIKEQNIIYINFESLDFDFIKNAKELFNYVESLRKNDDKYYIFLNEIQKIEDFEKAINSLRITNNYSIFITGPTSRMNYLKLSTDISGRYVSFKIFNL